MSETTPGTFKVNAATEPVFGFVAASGDDAVLGDVHPETKCAGRACVVHNPSDHRMRDWPLVWRADKGGSMERTCPEHGVGHPDPDDLAYHVAEGRDWVANHGCCGCCREPAVSPDGPCRTVSLYGPGVAA